jgi:hypothetical protein
MQEQDKNNLALELSPSRQVDQCLQAFSAIIASNEEEDIYQLWIDR